MPSIRKQKVGKYTYWQIVESRRVDGKPRPFVLMHLGTVDQLLRRLKEGPIRQEIRSFSHGAVAALLKVAKEIGLDDIFVGCFSSRRRDGIPVGKSLLLAAIHRAIQPGSKRSFGEWASKTTLPKMAGFDPEKLQSQHFWDQMDAVTDEELEAAERETTLRLLELGLLSPRLLFYDLTNFFTYIATGNSRSSLAMRGRNKQKRNDLRQFGLAQAVTKEFLIPVLWELYEGAESDEKRFIPFLTRARQKLSELNLDVEEVTVVFDKGSNSRENFAELDRSGLGYVASLSPSHHKDLIDVPISRYENVRVGGGECLCYRTKKEVWGKERTVVVYVSEKLRRGQLRGLASALAKKEEKLKALRERLRSPISRRKRESVEAELKKILQGEGQKLLRASVTQDESGRLDLAWHIDPEAYRWTTENLFGKRILATCRHDWSTSEIVGAYWGQSNVERVFRHLKNPYHHAVHPQYHWTDQKIKVHTFICLTALLLSQLLLRKAAGCGFDLSIDKLIDRLGEVRKAEVLTLDSPRSKPRKEVRLEAMDDDLRKLYCALVEEV